MITPGAACDSTTGCKFWTYLAASPSKLCFLLSNCDQPSYGQDGLVTGPKGCTIPTATFTLFNLMETDATDCAITWENSANCAAQDCGTITSLKPTQVTYIAEPAVLACGKIASLTVKRGGTLACAGLTDAPILSPYYIKESADKTSCDISNSLTKAMAVKFKNILKNI